VDWFRRLVKKSAVTGHVDVQASRIRGWAYDPSASPVQVDVYVEGKPAGHTLADRYRADLTAVSPDGRCAFEYVIPPGFLDGTDRTIEVRAHGTRKPLVNGRFTARLLPQHYHAGLIRWMLRSGLWAMRGERHDGAVQIGGWFIPAPGNDSGRITANGRPLALSIGVADGEWKSSALAQLSAHSFAASVTIDPRWNEIHLSFGFEQPFNPLHDYHYPLFDIVTPEPQRRLRVAGHDSEFSFNLEGHTITRKLDLLAQRYAGKPLSGLGPVLDWGCGCGRTGRFLARDGIDLFGVDIDADNVSWCAAHVKGTFATISPEPPTAFAPDFFGAIYGISVFTHLDRDYEKRWLAELHRIARPGALLFFSVLGGVAAARAELLEQVVTPESNGFFDAGRNRDIDAVTQGSDYYRNVFHQPGYIVKVWGQYFEILAIEEGIIGNHQDLVIARKPR
jgi:SAM-dependent methyltransferase